MKQRELEWGVEMVHFRESDILWVWTWRCSLYMIKTKFPGANVKRIQAC